MQTEPSKVVVVASGTQGEPMSALSRIAVDNHKNLSLERGDTVVLSSRIIPGNEKGIYRMINHFAKRGADVIYGSHESARACVGSRQRRGAAAGPESGAAALFSSHPRRIPAAGQARLAGPASASARVWKKSFVLETGETLEDRSRGRAPGREGAPSAACASIRARSTKWWRTSSFATGAIFPRTASCCRSSPSTRTPAKNETLPEIVSRGFMSFEDGSELLQSARQVVARTLESPRRGAQPIGA